LCRDAHDGRGGDGSLEVDLLDGGCRTRSQGSPSRQEEATEGRVVNERRRRGRVGHRQPGGPRTLRPSPCEPTSIRNQRRSRGSCRGPIATRFGEELCSLVDRPNSLGQSFPGIPRVRRCRAGWPRGASDRQVTRRRDRRCQSGRRKHDGRFDLQERYAEQAGTDTGFDENSVREAFSRIGNGSQSGCSGCPRRSRHAHARHR
jgi:hypothetical protein